jgi:hypothetical protein
MHNDCTEVDKLLLGLADYKNDYADVAAEKTIAEVLYQLGGLSVPTRPRA